jgi:hypothetical protein
MDRCCKQVEGEHGKCVQYRCDEGFASDAVLLCGSVDSAQQLRGRDGGYRDQLIAAKVVLEPLADGLHRVLGGQGACGPFELDENGGVQDRAHGSDGTTHCAYRIEHCFHVLGERWIGGAALASRASASRSRKRPREHTSSPPGGH